MTLGDLKILSYLSPVAQLIEKWSRDKSGYLVEWWEAERNSCKEKYKLSLILIASLVPLYLFSVSSLQAEGHTHQLVKLWERLWSAKIEKEWPLQHMFSERITWAHLINSLPLQEPQETVMYWCLPDLRPVVQCLASRELDVGFWSEIQWQEVTLNDLMVEVINRWTKGTLQA